MGLESSGWLHSKALIKLEKTREEPKSSAAGERKELMLKSKTLESIFGRLVSLAMRTHGDEAPACLAVLSVTFLAGTVRSRGVVGRFWVPPVGIRGW